MEYRTLGKTGLSVSHLCFGVLTIGPLQANLPLAEGVALLEYAASRGSIFLILPKTTGHTHISGLYCGKLKTSH